MLAAASSSFGLRSASGACPPGMAAAPSRPCSTRRSLAACAVSAVVRSAKAPAATMVSVDRTVSCSWRCCSRSSARRASSARICRSVSSPAATTASACLAPPRITATSPATTIVSATSSQPSSRVAGAESVGDDHDRGPGQREPRPQRDLHDVDRRAGQREHPGRAVHDQHGRDQVLLRQRQRRDNRGVGQYHGRRQPGPPDPPGEEGRPQAQRGQQRAQPPAGDLPRRGQHGHRGEQDRAAEAQRDRIPAGQPVQGLVGWPVYPRTQRPPEGARGGMGLLPDGISCRFHRTSMRQDHGTGNSNVSTSRPDSTCAQISYGAAALHLRQQ